MRIIIEITIEIKYEGGCITNFRNFYCSALREKVRRVAF